MKLGGSTERKIDLRVIAATNAKLEEEVKAGRFREDLWFRLNKFVLRVPALRERREDVPLLAAHFCRQVATEMGRQPPSIHADALEILNNYSFPGNIRELKNIIESALIQSRGGEIRPEHLNLTMPDVPTPMGQMSTSGTLPTVNLEALELVAIREALSRTEGNVVQAARLLGVDRGKVYRRLGGTEVAR